MNKASRVALILTPQSRSFGTSYCLCSRKTRVPFDNRFPVTAKHVNRHKEGGSEALEKPVAKHVVQSTGYFDKQIGKFRKVPEMIPEFVVPDLKGFKLKAYVSYKVEEVSQTKFTAEDLFDACYGKGISDKVKEGKITLESVQKNYEKS